MVENHIIQQLGFRNVRDKAGNPLGFQFAIIAFLYRGMFLSQFRTGKVTVDGVDYPKSALTWEIQGVDYTAEEMYELDDVYWPLDEPAIVKVPKAGGLAPGYHDVAIELGWVNAYGFSGEKQADGSGLGNGAPMGDTQLNPAYIPKRPEDLSGGQARRRLLLVW